MSMQPARWQMAISSQGMRESLCILSCWFGFGWEGRARGKVKQRIEFKRLCVEVSTPCLPKQQYK